MKTPAQTFWAMLLLVPMFPLGASAAAPQAGQPLWTSRDTQGQTQVHLYVFWTLSCPHCRVALPFVEKLAQKHPWLRLHRYELTRQPDLIARYRAMAGALGEEARSVPAFFFCGRMRTGFRDAASSGRELETELLDCRSRATAQEPPATAPEPALDLPGFGRIEARDLSLPVFTLVIAGLDAFNPCAFFVLLFLLSLLVHGRSRSRMLVIGGLFVLVSGLIYFLFMAAWLNVFLLLGELRGVTALAGLIAVLAGLVNIKDFFWFKQGLSLSIPERAQPSLFRKMRELAQAGRWPAMITATLVLAVAANSYEVLCTAGFPMLYARVLTLHDLSRTEFYLYLVFYNLIYILPLLAIVVLFAITLGGRKLSEAGGRVLKLFSGLMMLGLGGIMLASPEKLSGLLAPVALMIVAAVLTLLGYRFALRRR